MAQSHAQAPDRGGRAGYFTTFAVLVGLVTAALPSPAGALSDSSVEGGPGPAVAASTTLSAKKIPGRQLRLVVRGKRLGKKVRIVVKGRTGRAKGTKRAVTLKRTKKRRAVKRLKPGKYRIIPKPIKRGARVATAARKTVRVRKRKGARVVIRYRARRKARERPDFTYSIDPTLSPRRPDLPDTGKGPRPLAAVRDELGVVTAFVENEVILAPRDPAELDRFLRTYGGTVVESDEIAAPPAGLRVSTSAAQRAAREYTIRVDASGFPLKDLAADAAAVGFSGSRTLSSRAAAGLMALMVRERLAGADVSPNFAYEPSGSLLFETQEHPIPGTTDKLDAFNWPALPALTSPALTDTNGTPTLPFGSDLASGRSDVLRAWQFVAAHGTARRTWVAIIDGGFWLDQQGMPGTVTKGVSDLASGDTRPIQYDFDDDDFLAGGPILVECPKKSCTWHGNNSASVAVGIADNQYGSAGTGGWVADPMLFKTNLLRSQIRRAIRKAVVWGADVVNISTNGDCNFDCGVWLSGTFNTTLEAQQNGVVLVASAGNTATNLDQTPSWPCSVTGIDGTPGTICVGALQPGTVNAASSSSYGGDVDLFAPTNIPSTPNPATKNYAWPLDVAGGTSASAPFVAGVVAMMRAVDPSLTPAQIDTLLKSTAATDSSDGKVTRYLDAYRAVRAAAGDVLPADVLEPNNSPAAASGRAVPSTTQNLTISPSDPDHYSFTVKEYSDVSVDLTYMAALGGLGSISVALLPTGTQILKPTISNHPALTTGQTVTYPQVPPGTYTVRLTATVPNLYTLGLSATPASLAPDAFEVNNTAATAASPGSGLHLVNLHNPADMDHYRFTVPAGLDPNLKVFHVGVSADQAVEMRLYKNGVDLGPVGTSESPSIDLWDAGDYVVRIDAPTTTRYTLRLGEEASAQLTRPDFPVPIERLWFIDPTDAARRWLADPRETFVLPQSDYLKETFAGVRLTGEGLQLALYDLDGTLLARGRTTSGQGRTPTAEISLDATVADRDYILVVERIDPSPPDMQIPLIPYTIGWPEVP